MFIISPNEFLLPHIGMTPFTTEHITKNHLLQNDDFSLGYLNEKFGHTKWNFTNNGKEALEIALKSYNFQKDDLITIVTTSNNFYISSCVTKEIEKVCRWNREVVAETKLIIVNHEFGYPYPDMEKIKSFGLPIIEDCCTTFFSQDINDNVGKYGDFTIYSLPKFFPMQIGGIIVSNIDSGDMKSRLTSTETKYIINSLSNSLKNQDNILENRAKNYDYGLKLFSMMGFQERFVKEEKVVPYAMLLRNNGRIKDLNNFKSYMTKNGIQNSVFYGEDGFFIPIHQSLNIYEIQFINELISHYLKHNN
jgi:dTDP-4-amino-4,6-dideoxygalactose transaminase